MTVSPWHLAPSPLWEHSLKDSNHSHQLRADQRLLQTKQAHRSPNGGVAVPSKKGTLWLSTVALRSLARLLSSNSFSLPVSLQPQKGTPKWPSGTHFHSLFIFSQPLLSFLLSGILQGILLDTRRKVRPTSLESSLSFALADLGEPQAHITSPTLS